MLPSKASGELNIPEKRIMKLSKKFNIVQKSIIFIRQIKIISNIILD
jgi:hypothetical protein